MQIWSDIKLHDYMIAQLEIIKKDLTKFCEDSPELTKGLWQCCSCADLSPRLDLFFVVVFTYVKMKGQNKYIFNRNNSVAFTLGSILPLWVKTWNVVVVSIGCECRYVQKYPFKKYS